ncbi:MAG: HypC/HybG/HupF family hydrogenase formation chaperone [Candidatus Alcyoniella australis]|nr:HypC/HybG/HupF family hydrogenase formation chaperone [Candidatus Alcyoniella australis]
MCLAVPLRLIDVDKALNVGTVSSGSTTIEVGLDLVPDAQPGDYLLVHAGMAIERMDEDEARKTIEIYREYAQVPGMIEPEHND